MFKVEIQQDKAVIIAYGYVGGYYLDFRNIAESLSQITKAGIKKIDFHIHTNGGDVFEGNLMYNFLSSFKGEIDIYIDGIAASMGGIMILAGTRVHIAENGFIMLHSPSGYAGGTAKDHLSAAKLLRSIEGNFIKKLAAKTGKTEDAIRAEYLDGADHWIDADEAITLKLADDKFKAVNGAISFSKADVKAMKTDELINAYVALTTDTFTNTDDSMKNVNLKLKLAESASEADAVAAIDQMEKDLQAARAELLVFKNKEKDAKKAEAVALVDAAITEQRITASAREQYLSLFEKDFETAKAALAAVPKRQTAKDFVEGGDTQPDEKLVKMSWDEADKAGVLAELKQKHPDLYKAKFKAEFGKEPS